MRIAGIEVFQADLPYAGGIYRLSGGRTYESFRATIVRLTTECGLEGWGESTPFGSTFLAAHAGGVVAGLAELAPQLIGFDPRHYDRLNERMDRALLGHNHAKSPIDGACWDIAGKAFGLPVCELLGGRGDAPIPVISSIHGDTPDAMRAHVARCRDQGFMAHSIKIGADEAEGGPALDAERIKACLADRLPGEWYQADANSGLTVEHALRLLGLLGPADIVLEAPCATIRETLALRQRTSIPIMADELVQNPADLIDLLTLDAVDGVNIKISKQGGLTKSRQIRDLASNAGLTISVQETVGSTIAFAGLLHLAESTSRRVLRSTLDNRVMVTNQLASINAPIIDGGVRAPAKPGLGLTVDRAALGQPIAVYSRPSL